VAEILLDFDYALVETLAISEKFFVSNILVLLLVFRGSGSIGVALRRAFVLEQKRFFVSFIPKVCYRSADRQRFKICVPTVERLACSQGGQ
jgi:hypothetical protein